MHVTTIYDGFWREEAGRYAQISGAIFCDQANEESLLPYALVRNLNEIETLTFALRFWDSCSRLARELRLSTVRIRIADTRELSKPEDELDSTDYYERICVLTGPATDSPSNGYFYSYAAKTTIQIKDGVLETREYDYAKHPSSIKRHGLVNNNEV